MSLDLEAQIASQMSAVQDEFGVKQWQCNECGYYKKYKTHIRKHIERVHVKLQLKCQNSSNIFSTTEQLKTHMKNCDCEQL